MPRSGVFGAGKICQFASGKLELVCCVLVLLACARAWAFEGLDGPQRPPTTVATHVGGHAAFNCELDFPQDIEIPYILNWTKDGQPIFSWNEGAIYSADEFAGRIELLNGGQRGFGRGSINLTSIRETDSGWFECRVLFPNRSPIMRNNGTWFHLEVEGGNLIGIPPVNQTTMEGEQALFQCVTKPGDSFLKWYKDGEPISSIGDLSHRSWVGQDGSLTISPTDMADLGDYTCEVVNSIGDRQTAKASLNVQYKAKVIYTPRELYLPYGRSAVLDCHFRANPPLSNLRWEKDGFLFDPYNVPGVFYRRNGSLFFSKVDESHAGQYACTPYNELGSKGPSPHISVIVQRPPTFTATPLNLYLRRLGESISLPCDAVDSEANHRPTIIWTKKDGGPMPDGRYQLLGGNLTIENIEEADRGLYQCSASNEAAAVTAETELMIENVPPRAPFNLHATPAASSVTLQWVPATSRQTLSYPSDGSNNPRPMLEYQVWYRPVDLTEWRTVRVSSGRTTEATISHLSPGREYEFMVFSPDRFGEGMFSKSVRVWTKGRNDEDSGSTSYPLGSMNAMGAPRDLGIRLTTEGYMLEWLPPLHGRDLLRVYIVKWFRGTDEDVMGTAETKNNYYLIEELEEDEEYHFQVNGLSTNDYIAMSSKVSIHVPAYGKIRAAVAGVACVVLLTLAGALFWFSRHRLGAAANSGNVENRNSKSNGDR